MINEKVIGRIIGLGVQPDTLLGKNASYLSINNALHAILITADDFQFGGPLREKWIVIFKENFPEYDIKTPPIEWLQKQYMSEDAIIQLLLDTICKFGQSLEIES